MSLRITVVREKEIVGTFELSEAEFIIPPGIPASAFSQEEAEWEVPIRVRGSYMLLLRLYSRSFGNVAFNAYARLVDHATVDAWLKEHRAVPYPQFLSLFGMTDFTPAPNQKPAPSSTADPKESSLADQGNAAAENQSENTFRPYRINGESLEYTDAVGSGKSVPLTASECAAIARVIEAGVGGINFTKDDPQSEHHATYISRVKKKLREAKIPDHIHTPGKAGLGPGGGVYAIREEVVA